MSPAARPSGHALLAATGILLSRIAGLVRQRVIAHYLGTSLAAAAFLAAMRIPNFLQNLLGEGVLSASFIPVYAALVGKGERDQADRVAGAVFGLLALSSAVLCALGMAATPLFIDVITPGFQGEARALCTQLVRILFPGVALLVLSAWCLGILNSHGRFLLSYAAPVVWNGAMIVVLIALGGRTDADDLALWLAWGAVAGSALQLAVQLPSVLAVLGRLRPSLEVGLASVRQVIASFGTVLLARGVVQVSAYIDTAYASMLSSRAVAVLLHAQPIALLPISLFGMAVSAAELPEMSRAATGDGQAAAAAGILARLRAGLSQIGFFVVPSAVAFFALGDVLAAALLETGHFRAADTRFAWYLLAGSGVGLLAQTSGRLYASAFYALRDTRTPLRFALLRVALTAVLAWFSVTRLPTLLGLPRDLGGVGITATTGLCAWIEYALLRRALGRRLGEDPAPPRGELPRLWLAALVAAAVALGAKALLGSLFGAPASGELYGALLPMPALHPVVTAALLLPAYGAAYFAACHLAGVTRAGSVLRRILRRR